MIIQEFEGCNKEKSYQITIQKEDKISPVELSKSFIEQYPFTKALLIYTESEDPFQIGLMILGLNLGRVL